METKENQLSIAPIDRLQWEQLDRLNFMTQKQKLLRKLLSGSNNIAFDDMVTLVRAFGFTLSRVNGSHHIFENSAIGEQLNLQNKKGTAKPYQNQKPRRKRTGYETTVF